jgi:hypothetical protein
MGRFYPMVRRRWRRSAFPREIYSTAEPRNFTLNPLDDYINNINEEADSFSDTTGHANYPECKMGVDGHKFALNRRCMRINLKNKYIQESVE